MKRYKTMEANQLVDSVQKDYDEFVLALKGNLINNENYRKMVLDAVKHASDGIKNGSKIYVEIPENEKSIFYPEIMEWLIEANDVAQNHGGGVKSIGGKNMDEILNAYCNFDNVLESFRALNLSPFENLLLVSKYISSYKYKSEEDDSPGEFSRELINVLNDDLIVCVGYAKLMNLYLNRLGVPCREKSMKEYDGEGNVLSGHRANTIHLVDKKYGIDGYYHLDACWNSEDSGSGFFYTALPIKTRNSIFPQWRTVSWGLKNIDSGLITKNEFADIIFDTMYEESLEFIQITPNEDIKFEGKNEGFENFAKFIVSESENNSKFNDLTVSYLDFCKLAFSGVLARCKADMNLTLRNATKKMSIENPTQGGGCVNLVNDAKLYLNPETRSSSKFYNFCTYDNGFDFFYTRFACFGEVRARLKEIKDTSRPIEIKKYTEAYLNVLKAQGVKDFGAKKRMFTDVLERSLQSANEYGIKVSKETIKESIKVLFAEVEGVEEK